MNVTFEAPLCRRPFEVIFNLCQFPDTFQYALIKIKNVLKDHSDGSFENTVGHSNNANLNNQDECHGVFTLVHYSPCLVHCFFPKYFSKISRAKSSMGKTARKVNSSSNHV
jgi:hypothetical protein